MPTAGDRSDISDSAQVCKNPKRKKVALQEKNRRAQRRFRQRQKEKVQGLSSKVAELDQRLKDLKINNTTTNKENLFLEKLLILRDRTSALYAKKANNQRLPINEQAKAAKLSEKEGLEKIQQGLFATSNESLICPQHQQRDPGEQKLGVKDDTEQDMNNMQIATFKNFVKEIRQKGLSTDKLQKLSQEEIKPILKDYIIEFGKLLIFPKDECLQLQVEHVINDLCLLIVIFSSHNNSSGVVSNAMVTDQSDQLLQPIAGDERNVYKDRWLKVLVGMQLEQHQKQETCYLRILFQKRLSECSIQSKDIKNTLKKLSLAEKSESSTTAYITEVQEIFESLMENTLKKQQIIMEFVGVCFKKVFKANQIARMMVASYPFCPDVIYITHLISESLESQSRCSLHNNDFKEDIFSYKDQVQDMQVNLPEGQVMEKQEEKQASIVIQNSNQVAHSFSNQQNDKSDSLQDQSDLDEQNTSLAGQQQTQQKAQNLDNDQQDNIHLQSYSKTLISPNFTQPQQQIKQPLQQQQQQQQQLLHKIQQYQQLQQQQNQNFQQQQRQIDQSEQPIYNKAVFKQVEQCLGPHSMQLQNNSNTRQKDTIQGYEGIQDISTGDIQQLLKNFKEQQQNDKYSQPQQIQNGQKQMALHEPLLQLGMALTSQQNLFQQQSIQQLIQHHQKYNPDLQQSQQSNILAQGFVKQQQLEQSGSQDQKQITLQQAKQDRPLVYNEIQNKPGTQAKPQNQNSQYLALSQNQQYLGLQLQKYMQSQSEQIQQDAQQRCNPYNFQNQQLIQPSLPFKKIQSQQHNNFHTQQDLSQGSSSQVFDLYNNSSNNIVQQLLQVLDQQRIQQPLQQHTQIQDQNLTQQTEQQTNPVYSQQQQTLQSIYQSQQQMQQHMSQYSHLPYQIFKNIQGDSLTQSSIKLFEYLNQQMLFNSAIGSQAQNSKEQGFYQQVLQNHSQLPLKQDSQSQQSLFNTIKGLDFSEGTFFSGGFSGGELTQQQDYLQGMGINFLQALYQSLENKNKQQTQKQI